MKDRIQTTNMTSSFSQFQHQLRGGTTRVQLWAWELLLMNFVLLLLGGYHVAAFLTSTQQWCAAAGCILLFACVCAVQVRLKKQTASLTIRLLLFLLNSIVEGCLVYGVVIAIGRVFKSDPDKIDAIIQATALITLTLGMVAAFLAILMRVLCLPDQDDEDDEDEKTNVLMDEAYKPLINPQPNRPINGNAIAYISNNVEMV